MCPGIRVAHTSYSEKDVDVLYATGNPLSSLNVWKHGEHDVGNVQSLAGRIIFVKRLVARKVLEVGLDV